MSNRMDLKGWSERRPRAWRRGRVLPIWQGSNRTRPLHRRHIPKSIQFDTNSSCETIVFPDWTMVLEDGVYYQICLDEICFLLNGLGDKIVRTWCCRGCGRRALGFMCAPRAKPPTATSGVLITTVSAVRGRRARVTAENRNPPDRLAGDGAEVP